jgi:hypothetical protein
MFTAALEVPFLIALAMLVFIGVNIGTKRAHAMTPSGSPASGGGATAQPQFVEEPAIYYFTYALTSGQAVQRIAVNIDRDSDFLWTGLTGVSTGGYTLNVRLPSGRLISSAQMISTQLVSSNPNQPTAIGPPPIYRAGSTGPELDLTDTSMSGNTVTLIFWGVRRLRTA